MTMPNLICGVDVGKKGAVAWKNLITGGLGIQKIPLVKGKEVDERELGNIFNTLFTGNENPLVVVEKATAMPHQGGVSMFSFGETYGLIRGILIGMGISYLIVRPQDWKAEILRGTAKDKEAAISYVKRLYPDLVLRKSNRCPTDDDNMADAVCLMEYGIQFSRRSL